MAFFKAYRHQQDVSPTSDVGRLAGYRQSLADRCDDGIAIIDGDGVIQFVNETWASMHGNDKKDLLVGRHISSFYSRKVADEVNRFLAQTKLLGWYIATVNQIRSDGSSFAAQVKMVVLKDESAKPCGILLILSDMSRLGEMQKMIERTNVELEAIKERLNRFDGATAVGILMKPANTGSERVAAQSASPLPVAELKQLSEMAKRLR